jgi:hypothetical protein
VYVVTSTPFATSYARWKTYPTKKQKWKKLSAFNHPCTKRHAANIDAFTKNLDVRSRGFKHLVPIGRLYTQQEEKNDADDDSESEVASVSNTNVVPSADEQEEEEGQDLDASMEDLDEQVIYSYLSPFLSFLISELGK